MQEFYINKGSVLPELRMELIYDGRHDFNKFYEAVQNANITFTMADYSTGVIKIANAPCKLKPREGDGCVEEYIICYEWKERDTKKPGIYKGQFTIDFLGDLTSDGVEYPSGKLVMPIREDLMINIQ